MFVIVLVLLLSAQVSSAKGDLEGSPHSLSFRGAQAVAPRVEPIASVSSASGSVGRSVQESTEGVSEDTSGNTTEDATENSTENSTEHSTEHATEDAAKRIERQTQGVYPYIPIERLKEARPYIWDQRNRMIATGGLLAIAIARSQDEEAQAYFRGQGRIGAMEDVGNEVLGTGVPGAILGAGFWLFGDWTNRPRAAHAGQAQLETLLVTGLSTSMLKGLVNRRRPDGSDYFSFPSGHTSTVFATATVLNEFYGWKVGGPAFALGALTAIARISDNRHWLSDTVGGATLALLIGRAFSKAHIDRFESLKKAAPKGADVAILPMVEPDGFGLSFRLSY